MSATLYWLQCGGCGGDTHSFLNAADPGALELFEQLALDVLWQPSLSNITPAQQQALTKQIVAGQTPLDILCIEGALLGGPRGSGQYDRLHDRPKKEWVSALAERARFVVAVGTCASYGGFGAEEETQASGLQFLKWTKGGLLGDGFVSRGGLPVINLPGCPCHPAVLAGCLAALVEGFPLALDELNRPLEWYGMTVHQGCTRNEYHEYRVEEECFGERGCLFFYMGCHGPLVYGPCNKLLWNGRSSKTRAGVPCFGCTRPDFPQRYPFFKTRNIEGIPLQLPDGVSRAHYMAYKGMAAAAAPQRLKDRKTSI